MSYLGLALKDLSLSRGESAQRSTRQGRSVLCKPHRSKDREMNAFSSMIWAESGLTEPAHLCHLQLAKQPVTQI